MNIQTVLTKDLLFSFIDQFLEPGTTTSNGVLEIEGEEVLYASCKFAITNKFFLSLREKQFCNLSLWTEENDFLALVDKRHFYLAVFKVVGNSFHVFQRAEPNCSYLFSSVLQYEHNTYSDSWIGSILYEFNPGENIEVKRFVTDGINTKLYFCESESKFIFN